MTGPCGEGGASLLALLPAGVVHGVVAALSRIVAAWVRRAVGAKGRADWVDGWVPGAIPPPNVYCAPAKGQALF